MLGVMGWQDSYDVLPDGAVVCRLRIRIGAEWIDKRTLVRPPSNPTKGTAARPRFPTRSSAPL